MGPPRIPTLVTVAVPTEAAPLLRRCPGRPMSVRGAGLARSARAWEVDGGWVVVTGMGRRNTRLAVEWMLHRIVPARILTAGFAGGLNPALPTGTVVVSAAGDFPGYDRLLAGDGVRHGTIRTMDRVVVTVAEKAVLWDETGVDAVEMESEEVLIVAAARGIPAAVVRVVSDGAGEALPLDFNRLMTPDMELDPLRLAVSLLGSPGRIPDLLWFQRQVNRAAARLAPVLAGMLSGDG